MMVSLASELRGLDALCYERQELTGHLSSPLIIMPGSMSTCCGPSVSAYLQAAPFGLEIPSL